MTHAEANAKMDQARALSTTALHLVDAGLKDLAHYYYMRSYECHVGASFYFGHCDGDEYAT
jgi:hypothetical protein